MIASEKADLLTGMPPPADPTLVDKVKSWSWLWGVAVFAIFMVGVILLFWDDMHVKKTPGRPEVQGAELENVKEEAGEYGVEVETLAKEVQLEALEESGAAAGAQKELEVSEDQAQDAIEGGGEASDEGGDARRRRLLFAVRPARRFLVAPAM